ncbi:zinc finger protein 23 [Danaus plexippus plexippus]|uniref:Zinc finger protein 23 n=1 Tax=Danaus plexippus plexippus TaxID=278856 RepID=A0A212FHB5_DANPL|nr:zinc finger protein 23 [Danaus plexippus plexippus]
MEDLCTACLCSGRNLFNINGTELQVVYSQILNEISISDTLLEVCLRVCFECRALLRRYHKFKKQVQCCYTSLLKQIKQDTPSEKISNVPHLKSEPIHNLSYPDDIVKVEFEDVDVKNEVSDREELHYEPETFVKDLQLAKKEAKDKKTTKKKTKQKIKLKTKNMQAGESEVDADVKTRADLFSCQDCGRNFDEKLDLEKHIIADHTLKKEVKNNGVKETLPERPQCVECGKVFSSRKTYRYHLNVLHKGQNRYPCPRCGKVYQWKSNLGRHLRSHKARDSGELHCHTCDKRFASVATYRQHLRVSRSHVSETDFTFMCNECGKKFVNKTRLRDHIDWEHLNKIKFKCSLCNKPFKCHTSLYVHMQNVHRNKEKKDNLCHVCGKSYQNAAKLRYHIVAMHTSETPYSCGQCGAAFGWYSSLYRHMREVHHKMKVQPKKSKKLKKSSELVSSSHAHQAGPA